MTDAAPGERGARGWVAHLRAGGTTPWAEWAGEADHGGPVPGAQHLELLRRLNLAGGTPRLLVDEVLEASAAGRGRPDLDLVGAVADRPFGARPVDPAALPDDELVRVAVSVLADRLAATVLPDAPAPGGRPWRRPYRLVGDPWLADAAREQLVARGRPPGGRRAVVLVLGTDLPTMLADGWRHRVTTEGGPSWADWLDGAVSRDRVPPRVDLLQAARTWSERSGRDRVRLVLDPARLPVLAGTRRPLLAPPALAADGAELARRVAPVLGLLVAPDRRTDLLRRALVPRLAAVGGAPLAVPEQHRGWVRRRAARLRDDLRAAGYAVAGDLDTLVTEPAGLSSGGREPTEDGVLRTALRLLLDEDAAPDTSHHTSPQTDAHTSPRTSREDR